MTELHNGVENGELDLEAMDEYLRSVGGDLDPNVMEEYLRSVAKENLSIEEIRAQRISFVMGMLPHESTMTRERVEEILRRSYG
ncbi:MAG: hypothetical protein F4X66_03640 [Chloroflexi bacterium]|nr:hypothetical protein [Chloroflexota bacterium]MYE39515.1 hypothetical protein [Chloroflexota bacterium]